MASKEELENAKKLTEATNQLKNTLDEVLLVQRSLTDEARKSAKSYFDSTTQANATSKVFRQISNLTADINAELVNITSGLGGIENLEKQSIQNKQAQAALDIELSQLLETMIGSERKQAILKKEGEDRAKALNDLTKGRSVDEQDILRLYQEQTIQLQKQQETFLEIEQRAKNIEDGMGLAGKAFGGLGDVFKKIGGGKFAKTLGLDEAVSKGREYSAELTKGGTKIASSQDKTAVLGRMFSVVGKNIAKAFGPFALIAELIQGIMQANAETVKLQKSFLLTSEQAVDLRQDMAAVADSTGNINITATKLLGTMSSINDQFGFVARFSDETLVNTTRLTEQVGLSAEAANALAGLTELQGANAEELYESTVGTTLELQKQSGVQIDQKQILEQISKVTGTVRANLGSNPIEIAKAIQKAKEFGTSLEQVAAAGEQLLNFQQSIENELQAELLLGKNLNLERARAAALAGDQVTLAEELIQQAGSFAEFSSMNVIQQKALADAMGMSKDELADTLYQQELQLKGAEQVRAELAATGQDEAVKALDAQTAQDKFNATMEKLQAIVVDVATAFMPILDIVGAIAELIAPIIKFAVGISPAGLLSDLMSGNELGTMASSAIPTADDAIIPAGYGETIIKKGKDTIALNNEDSVVAGTNLGGGGTDMNETNQLLKMLVTQNKKKPQISPVGLYQVQ